MKEFTRDQIILFNEIVKKIDADSGGTKNHRWYHINLKCRDNRAGELKDLFDKVVEWHLDGIEYYEIEGTKDKWLKLHIDSAENWSAIKSKLIYYQNHKPDPTEPVIDPDGDDELPPPGPGTGNGNRNNWIIAAIAIVFVLVLIINLRKK